MTNVKRNTAGVTGEIVTFQSQPHYCIQHVDHLPPFLMTMVSPYDLWLFQSSRGGMTAGREDAGHALTPYYTDDKLHALSGQQGQAAQFWVTKGSETFYWAPFQMANDPYQTVSRHLYKHVYGHQITFEEIHHTLGLTFRCTWYGTDNFGCILQISLINNSDSALSVNGMYGVRQVLPAGVKQNMQDLRSNLMAAYKKNEWYGPLALYRLSAIPIDRAEPAEALAVNVAWHTGAPVDQVSLCDDDWHTFANQTFSTAAAATKGDNGAYLICKQETLLPQASWENFIVLDTDYQAHQIADLRDFIEKQDVASALQAAIAKTHHDLTSLLAKTDGLQVLGDKAAQYRHANNVMFNNMRGGLVFDGINCPKPDVVGYLQAVNPVVADRAKDWLAQLPETVDLHTLQSAALTTGDTDLIRLIWDYMPIGFSRRHGDPSRPWNAFHIKVTDDQGYNVLYYEGNWRDIFQNWEALSHSYPALLPSMVSKFWNATTIDGYNPYRIEKNGVDWEILEPHDDWSYVGYWGDHQIVYQTKLLERWAAVSPDSWLNWLDQQWFVCPDVPYRIRSAEALFDNAADTIDFDQAAHQAAMARVATMGWDGKNRVTDTGDLLKITGLEKLLVTISAKLDNLIPGVGIWMNTQRPEWNDANNALVGRGASAVTVYQLRRHIDFLHKQLTTAKASSYSISAAIHTHWQALVNALLQYIHTGDVMQYLQSAAAAGDAYRSHAYSQALGEATPIANADLVDQLALCLAVLDQTIAANKRDDGLYHAYHLVQTDGQSLHTEPLYLMLEGQAAVLDAGVLSKSDGWALMQALRASDLYESRQNSYLLYPNRSLPDFMDRNQLPAASIEESPWLREILEQPAQQVLVKGKQGYHFHATLTNAQALAKAIAPYQSLPAWNKAEEAVLFDLYENTFHHSAFTGRSGTFYGYEGLGSIYWHMVSKLVLALQQSLVNWQVGSQLEEDKAIRDWYADARAGIGWNKTPDIYGAVPLDPYSHTPYGKGARQPGMTGQVKEDIIARYGDLGVTIENGKLALDPLFIPEGWWNETAQSFTWPTSAGEHTIALPANSLAFSYAGVVVVYYQTEKPVCNSVAGKELAKQEKVDVAKWKSWRGSWVMVQV